MKIKIFEAVKTNNGIGPTDRGTHGRKYKFFGKFFGKTNLPLGKEASGDTCQFNVGKEVTVEVGGKMIRGVLREKHRDLKRQNRPVEILVPLQVVDILF